MLSGPRVWLPSALAAAATSGLTLWLAWVLVHSPPDFENVWGFAGEARGFSPLAPASGDPWSVHDFAARLRRALLLLWVVWGAAVAVAIRRRIAVRPAMILGGLVAALAMVAVPPMLSRDVFGYVAYGRVFGVHGLDPYVDGREALARLGDPASAFIVWDTPLPYGPLWVLVAGAIARAGQAQGLCFEILAHKLLAATALVAGAAAGSQLAGGARAGAVVLAICLNPLLLLESAGAGHNDAAMAALLLVAARLGVRNRHAASALSLGLAISIKPVVLAAVPLVLCARWRDGASFRQLAGLALAACGTPLLLAALVGDPHAFARAVFLRAAHGDARPVWLIAASLAAAAVVGWHLIRDSGMRPHDWLIAWVPLATILAVVVVQIRFPWYLTWALMPALTALDRRGVPWLAMCATFAFALMWQYGIPL
jgi:alpha-1,6-mannosyltransferase